MVQTEIQKSQKFQALQRSSLDSDMKMNFWKNLARCEKQARFGSAEASIAKDAPAFAEPPYLQIVCTHLWNKEEDNPDKIIGAKAYQTAAKPKVKNPSILIQKSSHIPALNR
jgi:hypothetical protein